MLSKFTKEDVDVKTKEVKKVARQIRQGHQKGENMRNLSQNENYYSQKNNLLPQEEGAERHLLIW